MNSPFPMPQGGTTPEHVAAKTRVITITKPAAGQSYTVNLSHDGSVKLDLSQIANEKIMIVKVPSGIPGAGEKAIIVFEDHSSITIDPFFFSGNWPINLTVDWGSQHDLTVAQFMADVPVTTDTSVIPAGGEQGEQSGQTFEPPSVDPLAPSNPLALLPPEELPNWQPTTLLATNQNGDLIPTPSGSDLRIVVEEENLPGPGLQTASGKGNEDANGVDDTDQAGPPFVDNVTLDVSGSLASLVSGGNLPLTFGVNNIEGTIVHDSNGNAVTSLHEDVTYHIESSTPTSTEIDGMAGGRVIFTFTLNSDGTFSFHLNDQIDHPAGQGENQLLLNLTEILNIQDADHEVVDFTTNPDAFLVEVLDDTPALKPGFDLKVVDEDDIKTFESHGTSPNDGNFFDGSFTGNAGDNGPGPATVSGNLLDRVSGGADAFPGFDGTPQGGLPVEFSLVSTAATTLTSLGLESQGHELSYQLVGNTLIGFVNNVGIGQSYDPQFGDRLVFTFTVDQNGDYKFQLFDQLDHDSGKGQNTDLVDHTQGDVNFIDFGQLVQATDFDGDSVVLDNKLFIEVRDDVPVLSGDKEFRFINEDDIRTSLSTGTSPNDGNADGSFTGSQFNNGPGPAQISGSLDDLVKIGADENPNTFFNHTGLVFSFDASKLSTLNNLGLESQGDKITFSIGNSGHDLFGYASDGRLVMDLTLQQNGDYTLKLYDQVDHDKPYDDFGDHPTIPGDTATADQNTDLQDNNPHADVDSINFGAVIKVTDFDGDSVSLNGVFKVSVVDDIPTVNAYDNNSHAVVVDETAGFLFQDNDVFLPLLNIFNNNTVQNQGHDPDMLPQYAQSSIFAPLVGANIQIGADEPGHAAWSLVLGQGSSHDSGLKTTEGREIFLFKEGDLIVGRYDAPGDGNTTVTHSDPAAFAIAIDPATGQVSLVQYVSIYNTNDQSFDETNFINSGEIYAKITVTDFDGDSASDKVDIGQQIGFSDDGPLALPNATVRLDDDNLANGNPNGPGDDFAPLFTTGFLGHYYGADGASPLGGITLTGADGLPSGFQVKAGGTDANLVIQQLQDNQWVDVLQVQITDTTSGAYTVSQLHAIDHPLTDGPQPGVQTSYEDNLSFTVGYNVTDGDGDHTHGTLTINVDDDSPTIDVSVAHGGLPDSALVNLDETIGADRYSSTDTATHDNNGASDDSPITVPGAFGELSTSIQGGLGALFNVSAHIGADTPGTVTGTLSLVLSGGSNGVVATGLVATQTGDAAGLSAADRAIVLIETGGIVEGVLASDHSKIAFTIQLTDTDADASTPPQLKVDQFMAIDNGNDNNQFDSTQQLLLNGNGSLSLQLDVTVTDHDGDSVHDSAKVTLANHTGSFLSFDDDGPQPAIVEHNFVNNGLFFDGFTPNGDIWGQGSGTDSTGHSGDWVIQASDYEGASFVELQKVADGYLGADSPTNSPIVDMEATPGNLQISQQINGLTDGAKYLLTFEVGEANFGSAKLNVIWDGNVIDTIDPTSGPMQTIALEVLASGTTGTLEFQEIGESGDNTGTFLANVRLSNLVIIDETPGVDADSNDTLDPSVAAAFAGVSNVGSDPAMGSPQFAKGTTSVVDIGTPDFGTDGPAANNPIQYGLQVASNGVDSGLSTTEGQAIKLFLENGIVVGRYDSNGDHAVDATDNAAFAISIDGNGVLSVAQYVSLEHPDHTSSDEGIQLDPNTISATVTLTDGDGDHSTASTDISNAVLFEDDGPSVDVSVNPEASLPILALDETIGADRYSAADLSHDNNGAADDTNLASPFGEQTTSLNGGLGSLFTVTTHVGADDPGTSTGALSLVLTGGGQDGVATNLYATDTGAAAGLALADRAIVLIEVGGVVEGVLASDHSKIAFTIGLTSNDPSAQLKVDQYMAIDHSAPGTDDGNLFDHELSLHATDGALSLQLSETVTDSDGDSANGSAQVTLVDGNNSFVTFDDDGPALKGVVYNNLGDNLIQNPSFEDGHADLGSSDWNIYSNIPGWTDGSDGIPFEVQTGGVGGVNPEDGNALIELDGDTQGNPPHTPGGSPDPDGHTNATIQQTIAGTEAGETYQISFWYSPRGGEGTDSSGLNVLFNGQVVYQIPADSNPPAGWQLITLQVTATGPDSVLGFQGTGSENEFGALIDNVSFREVLPLDDEDTHLAGVGIQGGPGDDGSGVSATGKILFDPGTDGLKSITFDSGNTGLKAVYVDPATGHATQEGVTTSWTANGQGGTLTGLMHVDNVGDITVFTLVVNADGTYTFTLNAPLAHPAPGANDPASYENNLDINLGFSVIDGDGDHVNGTVVINVDDDSPVAHNDTDAVTTGLQTLNFDDIPLANGQETPLSTYVEYGGFIFTQTGVYNPGGGTYAPTSGENLAFIGEKLPGADIPGYTGAAGDPITIEKANGELFAPKGLNLSSNSADPLTVVITAFDSGNNVIGTVTVSDVHQGSATAVDLSSLGLVDHITLDTPGGANGLFFGFDDFTYTDHLGSTTGNVITGIDTTSGAAGADSAGADGGQITAVAFGNVTDSTADGNGNFTINGAHGTLVLNADGTYTYTQTDQAGSGNTPDVFTYTLTDGDGDSTTATLTITSPTLTTALIAGDVFAGTVEEEQLVHQTNPADVSFNASFTGNEDTNGAGDQDTGTTPPDSDHTTNVATGSLTVTGGTGPYSFTFDTSHEGQQANFGGLPATSGGEPVLYHFVDGNTLIGYVPSGPSGFQDGTDHVVFELQINTDANSSDASSGYTFTLYDHLDHDPAANNGENTLSLDLGNGSNGLVTVTDSSGVNTPLHLGGSINVIDDTPVATNETAQASPGVKPTMNAVLVLDFSQSMNDIVPNTGGKSRLEIMKEAVHDFLSSTDVTFNQVTVYTFGVSASLLGQFNDPSAADSAISALNNTTAGTNYAAVTSLVDGNGASGYAQLSHPAADTTNLYFLSDGDPTGGTGLSGSQETAWTNFLNDSTNNPNYPPIDHVFALGFSDINSTAFLQQIAPRGGSDTAEIVTDPTQLSGTLTGTLPSGADGNILTDHVGNSFGADGGHVQSITVNGHTFTYDATSSNHDSSGFSGDATTSATHVTVTTGLGGELTFYFVDDGSHHAGDYTYQASQPGTDTIGFVLVDGDGDMASANLNIDVVPPDQAPVNIVPGAQTGVVQGVVYTFDAAHGNQISVSDVDANGGAEKVTLTATHGTITLSETTGLSFTAGDGTADSTMTFTGTIADINAALNGMSYVSDSNYSGPAQITITTNDQGNTGPGGPLSDTDTINLTVGALNDAPTANITNTTFAATEQTDLYLAGEAGSNNGNGASLGSIADVDAGNGIMTVTLSVASGILTVTAGNSGANVVSGSGTNTVTISGTIAQINNLLGGIDTNGSGGTNEGNIIYNANSDNPAASAQLTLTVHDNGNTGIGGDMSGFDTATINITAVNDAPTTDLNDGGSGQNNSVNFTEQTPILISPAGDISDVDSPNMASMTVTLTNHPDGASESLSLNSAAQTAATNAGLTVGYNSGTGVLLISGSASQSVYETILHGIVYNDTSDTPNTADRSVTVVVNDGSSNSTSHTVTIDVNAVNDAPTAEITQASYNATEQTNLTLSGTGLSIGDVDAGNDSITVKLSVTEGTLNATAGNSGANVSGNGTGTLTITGSQTQIDNLLGGIDTGPGSAGSITYIDNTNTPSPSATLTLSVNDGGNNGSGGSLTASDTATINIAAVNDAPNAGTETIIVTESTSVILPLSELNTSDPDGDPLAITATTNLTGVSGGNITTSHSDDSITFTTPSLSNDDTSGNSFNYTVSDGHGGTGTGTVNVQVLNDDGNINLSGSNYAYSYLKMGSGADSITLGSGHDVVIENAVVGTSSDSGRVNNGNNDTGQDMISNFSTTDDTILINATNVSNFVHGTNTDVAPNGYSNQTALVDLNQSGDAGDIVITFNGGTPSDSQFDGRLEYNLTGTNGNDTITTGALNDILSGGSGNDTLTGGAGDDTLTGGTGNDRFVLDGHSQALNGHDTITDFVSGSDDIFVDVASQNLTVDTATNVAAANFHTVTGTGGADENNAASWSGGTGNEFLYNQNTHELWYSASGTGSDKIDLAHMSTGVPASGDVHTF